MWVPWATLGCANAILVTEDLLEVVIQQEKSEARSICSLNHCDVFPGVSSPMCLVLQVFMHKEAFGKSPHSTTREWCKRASPANVNPLTDSQASIHHAHWLNSYLDTHLVTSTHHCWDRTDKNDHAWYLMGMGKAVDWLLVKTSWNLSGG